MPSDLLWLSALMLGTGLSGGFGHCLGMCGPIVVTYASAYRVAGIRPHVLYGLGRVTTYALMGAAAGLAGSLVPVASPAAQRWVMAGAGALVVLMGLGMAGRGPVLRVLERVGLGIGFIRRAGAFFGAGLTAGAYYPLGVVMGFIPCGLVYTALVASARASMDAAPPAAVARGMVLMAAFGAGTMPGMVLAGRASALIGTRMRGALTAVGAALMVAAGVMFIIRALR